jgi:hypothetical protein
MIVFDLTCGNGHQFEGWFGSSDDFAAQQERGLLECPQCGCDNVAKAPMAAAVPRKSNRAVERVAGNSASPVHGVSNAPMPPEVAQALAKLAEAQARALKDSTWVGNRFADDARAMHYGEQDAAPIHGEATPAQAQQLVDEGIEIAPLPFPVAPPKALN